MVAPDNSDTNCDDFQIDLVGFVYILNPMAAAKVADAQPCVNEDVEPFAFAVEIPSERNLAAVFVNSHQIEAVAPAKDWST